MSFRVRYLLAPTLCLAFVSVAAAAGTIQLPSNKELIRVVQRKDEVEIERLAARLGARRLWRLVERGSADEHRAALVALGHVEDGWAVAPELLHAVADPAEAEPQLAANALSRILSNWSESYLETQEIPPDFQRSVADGLLAEASRTTSQARPIPVERRLALLDGLGRLVEIGRIAPTKLTPLLHDGDPSIRAAAVAVVRRAPNAGAAQLELVVAGDTVAPVAGAAAAALCYDLALRPTDNAAEHRVARLAPPTRDRIRALATDESVALIERIDLLACLRAFATPADQQILASLAQKSAEPLKKRARQLTGAK